MLRPKFQHLKAFFFDLDGTLIDTAPDFAIAINQLREERGQRPLPIDAIRPHVSSGATGMITSCIEAQDETDLTAARERFLDIYFEINHPESALFPCAERLLENLEKLEIPWGIVTNKPVRFADPLIRKLMLQDRLCCLLCPDHVTARKPDPESLYMAAQEAGVSSDACIYFGDHERDIAAGQAAGMLTCSVKFGYIPANEDPLQWKADFHLDCFDHILSTFFQDTSWR